MGSEILDRFGKRAGFTLINVAEVGLPLFRVYANCLVIETTPFSVVEEYILRSLSLGIVDHAQICELLGLPERLVLSSLADMLREGLILERRHDSAQVRLGITPAGLTLLQERKRSRPRESELNFLYDGLTHRVIYLRETELLKPKQLRSSGIPELQPIPVRGPEKSEIKALEVTNYLADARPSGVDLDVLRINRIDRRERLFLPATALIFKATHAADEYQVAFVVDGRLAVEHEAVFRKEGGLERSQVFSALKTGKEHIDWDGVVGHELATQVKTKILEGAQVAPSGRPVLSLKSQEVRSNTDIVRSVVRQLPVLEHNPLMMQVLREASESIIIVSPWVRKEVVNTEFLQALRGALERKVRVVIAYGIKMGAYDEDMDHQVRRELEILGREFDGLTVKRLGDTHAKILVKDREFFVISSFNWLSFRGDPERQFREEWGTLVQSKGMTEDFLEKQLYPRLGLIEPKQ